MSHATTQRPLENIMVSEETSHRQTRENRQIQRPEVD